tara:strand:+ start:6616 stop:6783 length:168 start_codon:yes stop_codon:yes gene_type:complete
MELGLGQLRLNPRDFWSMTLPELSAAARGAGSRAGNDAMTRQRLASMVIQFPDGT